MPVAELGRSFEPENSMQRLAYLFPGQGSQIQGMGKSLWESSPAARKIFKEAEEILGYSIADKCFNGSAAELELTEIAQAGIGTVCLSAFAAFEEKFGKINPQSGAGISFGELPNLVAAQVFDLKTFFAIVGSRSRIMEEVGKVPPGEMMSVLGLSDKEIIEQTCRENKVYPAIYYPGIVIISGLVEHMPKAALAFSNLKAKVRPTGVKYPFHTPHMERAEKEFALFLKQFEFRDPKYPIILNATGEPTTSGEEIRSALPLQVTRTIDAVKVIQAIHKSGAKVVLEFCPKPTLASLVNRVDSSLAGISIFSSDSLSSLPALR